MRLAPRAGVAAIISGDLRIDVRGGEVRDAVIDLAGRVADRAGPP